MSRLVTPVLQKKLPIRKVDHTVVLDTEIGGREDRLMPKVGGKKFSYSKSGKKAAKVYAKKTGKKVKKAKGY